jgi:ankyrin repeat protein
VYLLVLKGADIDARNSNNQTAFMRAAIVNKIDTIISCSKMVLM